MKLTDIIKNGHEIQEGKSIFFKADKDFIYQGLPILKNSLVYYNGKSKINVNMIGFGMFEESNIPNLITDKLPQDNERNYLVEKCSNCEFEILKIPFSGQGIWHNNHVDSWSGSFSDYIERIKQSPVLEHSGIAFSSIMYYYNTLTESLDYFINVKPIKFEINDKLIELPELLEISRYKTSPEKSRNKSSYDIIPLNKTLEYHGIIFQGNLFLSEDGTLTGESAEEFDAEIFGYNELKKITISKGFRVAISIDGDTVINLFNQKTQRIEKYKIRKCE